MDGVTSSATVTEQLPPDVIAQLTGMDSAITPELVATSWAVLKPFHDKVGYTAPKVDRDLAYGDHERHRLDVHTAGDESSTADHGAPVLVFVHGGGFVGGDKHVPGMPMYDHIGAWAVRNGWVGVTITYRLAPDHTWPSGAQDVAAAVQWVRGNVAEHDPEFSHAQVAGLTAAWFAKKGTVPQVIWSAGHNHISQIGSVGVDDLALGAQLARFVNRVAGPCPPTTPSATRRERDPDAPEDPR
jgi:alpha/beta hydrolase fold